MDDAAPRASGPEQRRSRALFDTMPIGVVYQAADGRIVDANPAAETILGLTLDQMQGRTSIDPRWRAVHEDGSDFPGDEHPSMVALRTGRRVSGVVMGVYNPLTGEQRWIRVDATPLSDADGAAPGEVYTTFLDITTETEAEAARRADEARFRRLFETMSEGVAYCRMLFDEDGRPDDFVYESVNPAFAQLTGLEDVTGRRVTEVIPGIKAETPELLETYGRVARTGEPAEFDIDFTPLDMFLHIKVQRPEPGYFVAVFENITERRRILDALRESEQIRDTAERIARVGSWRYDPATQLATWSPGMFEIFAVQHTMEGAGWEPVDFTQILATRVHPDDRAAIVEATARMSARGGHAAVEFRLAWPDGSWHVLHGEGTAETDAEGRVASVSGYYQDVTDSRFAQETIARLVAELETRVEQRTAELATATQELKGFVYSISHDLRTPLRTIGSYSQILLQDHAAGLSDEAADALRRIERANARMVRLVDGLLELSGLARSSMQLRVADLTRLALEVGEELRDAEPGHEVELTVAPGLTARADEALLRVVLYDLLGNAWKFTAGREPAHVEVGSATVDGAPAFFVRDDGAGFDERYADKLFTPFERLHDDTQFAGTGIGLATVRRIVERHGGRVWAEGEVGGGATFWFTLP